MNRIRIAQIGTSRYSHGNDIINSLKQNEHYEIVGVCFPENEPQKFPERMADFEGLPRLSLEELLDDPTVDAVAVETEEYALTDYALAVVRAGKHLHMEKPGGTEPAAFAELIREVKARGTVLHLGYMYRYNPAIAALIARAKNGELGEILSVEAQMSCLHPREMREWLAAYKGGMTFFLGCHLLDIILSIQGKPTRILPLNKCSGLGVTDSEDVGFVALEYPHGISFAKASAVERGGFSRRQLVVTGSKAAVTLQPLERYLSDGKHLYTGITECDGTDWHHVGNTEQTAPFTRYDAMLNAFAAMVRGEKQNPYTPDYEWELYQTVMKACGVTVK